MSHPRVVPHLSPLAMEKFMKERMAAVRAAELGPSPDQQELSWSSSTTFEQANQVFVAFKTLEMRKDEHWLNRLACRMTARPGEIRPAGQLCHTELMLQVSPGAWYRFSINKKTGILDEANVRTWVKGRVHGKRVKPESMSKYVYLMLPVPRAKQKIAFDFLMSQQGAAFNFWGYVLNFFLPRAMCLGTRHWVPNMINRTRLKWFCTELVCCALQACGLFSGVKACLQSPNSLYRMCAPLSVGSGNPVTSNYINV